MQKRKENLKEELYLIPQIFKEFVISLVNNDLEKLKELAIKHGGLDSSINISTIDQLLNKIDITVKMFQLSNGVVVLSLNYGKVVRRWELLQRWSRGTYVIIDRSGNVELFFSFDKFFNLDEEEGWRLGDLTNLELVEATRKHDGTLMITFYSNILGQWILATRKLPHFYNIYENKIDNVRRIVHPQIRHAIEIEPKLELDNLKVVLDGLESYVHMFEAVDPERYPDEQYNLGSEYAPLTEKEKYVVYLTARRLDDLYLLRYLEAHKLIGNNFRKAEVLETKDLSEIERLVKSKMLGEGAVLRFESEEIPYRLVKVKNVIMFVQTEASVVLALVKGVIDDILPILQRQNKKLYEKALELRDVIPSLVEIVEKYANLIRKLLARYNNDEKKVRNWLKSRPNAVRAGIDFIISYAKGEITLEDAIVYLTRQLQYRKDRIIEWIRKVEKFLSTVDSS